MRWLVRLFGSLTDRANPIVVKELRQAVQSRFIIGVLLIYLLINVGVIGLFLFFQEIDGLDTDAGREVFTVLHAILVLTCMIMLPCYTGARLAAERNGNNMDLLYITTIKPSAIVRGKFLAALILTVLIFSTCMPFLSFTYLLRGISLPAIFFMLFIDFIVTAAGIMAGVFMACIKGGWFIMLLLGAVLLGGLVTAASGLIAISSNFLFFGGMGDLDTWAFWGVLGTFLVMILSAMGLLSAFAVAMLSPRAANRTIRIRIYLTATWILTGVVMAMWSYFQTHLEAVGVWVVGTLCVLSGIFLVAVSERDRWSPRVARTIPRSRLLRPLAFVFYCGSAGGIIWCGLMAAASIIFAFVWSGIFPSFYGLSNMEEMVTVTGGIFLFVYCYSLTAVLLRRVIFPKMPTHLLGLTSLLLMVFGCAIPMLVFILVSDDNRGGREFEEFWLITNPGILIYDSHRTFAMIFLTIWSALVTVLCMPWFFDQMSRFIPLKPTPIPETVTVSTNE